MEQVELEGRAENVWDEVREGDKVMLFLAGYGRESGLYSECD